MPNLRSFEVPTIVKHGNGAIAHLADEARALGMKRPLLVTGGDLVRAGLVREATAVLEAGRVEFVLFDEVIPNPPIALVDKGTERYRQEGCDGLIGFGGGSSLDTAK